MKSKEKLEVIILNCGKCNKETPHVYSGSTGVPWRSQEIYKCKICGEPYIKK